MSDTEITKPRHFIQQYIDADVAAGKMKVALLHVFHLNQMGIYTLVMQNQFA